MEVTRLAPIKLRAASETVAEAFFNYPMFTLYFPDAGRRKRWLAWYLGRVLNCASLYGEVQANAEVSGVIFTLPPGHTKISLLEYIRGGFLLAPLALGLGNYKRSMECEDFVARTHSDLMKGRPHYYLWGLAVRPGEKRKGIGTALMQPTLAKADAESMPVYLETHDEKNVAYYRRHGFELIHSGGIPQYGLKVWCMLRESH